MPTNENTPQPQKPSSVPFALAALSLVLCLALGGFGIFLPIYLKSANKAVDTSCMSSQKDLARGLTMYAMDFDGVLPSADVWGDAIKGNVDSASFRCPKDGSYEEGGSSYAFNNSLSKLFLDGIKNPNQTPMVFDATGGKWNLNGAPSLMPSPGRHNDGGTGNIVGFADGSVRFVKDVGP